MSDDVFHFTITVPAGTPQAAPLTTLTQFRASDVERVTWRLPRGTVGKVGFQVGTRGVQIIPQATGQFITGDGISGSYDLDNAHDTGDWSVIAFNTGAFPHSIHVTYHISTLHPVPEPFRLTADDDLSFWPTFEAERDG